jgi:hypothetical protein
MEGLFRRVTAASEEIYLGEGTENASAGQGHDNQKAIQKQEQATYDGRSAVIVRCRVGRRCVIGVLFSILVVASSKKEKDSN